MPYLRTRELLTPEQRLELKEIPSNLSESDMAIYYSFSEHDIDIINQHRRSHNKLGFAVQISVLRYPGWALSEIDTIPLNVLEYIAQQIKVDPDDFSLYAKREPTKREHLEEIRQQFGYKNFSVKEHHEVANVLLQYALENGNALYLIKIALDIFRKMKIILPAINTIERIVWEVRDKAEKRIYKIINENLSAEHKHNLDDLINDKIGNGITRFAWLKEIPNNHAPETFIKVVERLEYIRNLKLNIKITGIHPNRIRQLSKIGARYEPYALKKFEESKRYSILIIYLFELGQDLVDYAIEIHDRQINNLLSHGRKGQQEIQIQNGKALNEKIIYYVNLIKALIKAKKEGLDPFQTIENSVMPWEKLILSGEEANKLARPIDFDYLDLISNKYSYLRKYTPTLLNCFEFKSNNAAKPIIEALNVINDMNLTGKRILPSNAPVEFIPKRWLKHVLSKDGTINKQYYELAALSELKNCIRSGDISVGGSRKHRNFEDYLIDINEWKIAKDTGTRLAVSLNFEEYIKERMNSLEEILQFVSKNIGNLNGVTIENGELHINRLEKDTPEEAKSFSKLLYSMLPRINLTDLLLEVNNWTNFVDQFIHASSGKRPKEEEKAIILAALMAMGTNVGLVKMSEATQGITYYQMANAAQWRMYEDAFSRAQSKLVNYHHSLPLTEYWGEGKTSSSDGMRIPVNVSSLYAQSNPHFGSGKGITIYRWVSDQYSSYYVQTVITNTRDALYFIDGLLNHETDLDIKEHYTDTAGYTDQIFGLCHLLGFRFAPRLRDIADLKLYCFGKPSDYPNLEKMLKGKINTKLIRENFDDNLRLAHSIREGKVSSSLIMGKLGSYARQNSLAAGQKEMGQIEKTIYILKFISDEALRRRVQKGLNKGEATHALGRAVLFGKKGEFSERALKDQLQKASALNIIINAISIWNTVYLQKAVKYLEDNGTLNRELLYYISPLDWSHINFLGEYSFNLKNLTTIENLRPLNTSINFDIP